MTEHDNNQLSADEDKSIWEKAPFWRTAPFDTIVLLVLLLLANWFISRADPGWQRLNPTPWLLLPLFLGGRYGIGLGVFGAVLATISVVGLQWATENQPPLETIQGNPFFFLALLLAAVVGTIIHQLVTGPVERLRQRALTLAEKNLRLEEDNALYRANETRLVDSLLLHGAESLSLNAATQQLFAGERGQFNENLLALLAREFGITSAAIYRNDSGNSSSIPLMATTAVGESNFPNQLPSGNASLAAAALTKGQIASWNSPDVTGQQHLAAIPWKSSPASSGGAVAVLLIGRMDFDRINWETLSHIEAVFASCMAGVKPASTQPTTTL